MKKILYGILIALFVISCETRSYSPEYSNTLRNYPNDFIKHFPYKISNGILHETTNPQLDVIRLFLIINDSTQKFKILKDSLDKISIAKYSAQDSCLLIVNKFTTEQNFSIEKKANEKVIQQYLKKRCLRNKMPIPNFWGLYEENLHTLPQLPKDFDIYILEAKKGLFWDEKHRSSGEYMPDYWKHGYSRGIAMNDKTHEIIYWFVLW